MSALTPDTFTREWVQDELFELLDKAHGLRADSPALAVGKRGDDLVLFGPGAKQIVVLIEDAR